MTTRRRTIALTEELATNRGEVIVTLASNERHYPLTELGIEYNDSNATILEAVANSIQESDEIDIRDGYTLKKIEDTRNIYIFPKATAG